MTTLNTLDIDREISTMRLASKELISLTNQELAQLFQQCINQVPTFADHWVELEAKHKKIDPATPAMGEQWAGGPWITVWGFQYIIKALNDLPNIDLNFDKKYNKKRHTLEVFPTKFIESLLYMGVKGYIKLRNNMSIEDLAKYRGFESRINTKNPTTTLVLGAGNQSCIPILDFAYHIITRRSPVVLKLNPVNDYLKPIFDNVLAPFIAKNFLTVVVGDAELGKYLTKHQGISHIHLTGANSTYENIVYGRKLLDNEVGSKSIKKINSKSISTELGNVTPVIIVPDKWSRSDIKVQAKKVATAKLQNAGFNCIAAQVVVLDKNWKQKDQFIKEVKNIISQQKTRHFYYPGSKERISEINKSNSIDILSQDSCEVPYSSSITDNDDEFYFHNEIWGGSIIFKNLDSDSTSDFMKKATDFCNNNLWGNLGCTVLIKPRTERKHLDSFELMIDSLQYGTVAINEWCALGFAIPTLPWGGYPGNKDSDIQSGQGYVHNTFLFESPLNGIVRTQFKPLFNIDPPWFITHKNSHKVLRNLTLYLCTNSKLNLIKTFFYAVIS